MVLLYNIEQNILNKTDRVYSQQYWDKKKLAPSCLIYFIGTNKKINNLLHHNLFFDESFENHAKEIYDKPSWPNKPLFYVSATSKTDKSVAPENCENIFNSYRIRASLEYL